MTYYETAQHFSCAKDLKEFVKDSTMILKNATYCSTVVGDGVVTEDGWLLPVGLSSSTQSEDDAVILLTDEPRRIPDGSRVTYAGSVEDWSEWSAAKATHERTIHSIRAFSVLGLA